jgi:hypothetical protein
MPAPAPGRIVPIPTRFSKRHATCTRVLALEAPLASGPLKVTAVRRHCLAARAEADLTASAPNALGFRGAPPR